MSTRYTRAIVVLISTLWLHSADAELRSFREGNKIYLEGSSCELLLKQALAFKTWSTRADEVSGEIPPCTPSQQNHKFLVRIDEIAPSMVRNHSFTAPKKDGPNCFNTALVADKILDYLRYSSEEEMMWYLDSPLCKQVEESEIEPGDPVVLFNHPKLAPTQTEIPHVYVYISPELAFQKTGFMREISPFELVSPKTVSTGYDFPKNSDCKWVTGSPPKKCKSWSVGYHCISLDKFLEKGKTPTQWIGTRQNLSALECRVSQNIFEKSDPSKIKIYELITQTLEIIRKLAKDELNKIKGNSPAQSRERFLWQSIEYRIRSIYAQINYNSYGIFSDPN